MSRTSTHEEYIKKLDERNITWSYPLEEYVNNREKILHKCNICGDTYFVSPSGLLSGKKHIKCSYNERGAKLRKSIEQIDKEIKDLYGDEYVLVSKEYKSHKDKVIIGHNHKDGYHEFKVNPNSFMSGCGCGVCHGKQVFVGYNDVATTDSYILDLLVDKSNAYKYTRSSSKKVDFKCSSCGKIINTSFFNVINIGYLSCNVCGIGNSYNNKFIYLTLKEYLDIGELEYLDSEVVFDWSKIKFKDRLRKCRYDILFKKNNKNYIIEMDGGLGHGHKNEFVDLTVEEQLLLDKIKDTVAEKNGYKIIRIDSNYPSNKTRFEYVKNAIISSKLSELFDFNNINFTKIDIESQSTYYIQVCNMWNNGYKTNDIAKNFNLDLSTVLNYLHSGTENGICDYNSDEGLARGGRKKKVICLETGEILDSISEACIKYNTSKGTIRNSCLNKSAYRRTTNGKIYNWKFFEETI